MFHKAFLLHPIIQDTVANLKLWSRLFQEDILVDRCFLVSLQQIVISKPKHGTDSLTLNGPVFPPTKLQKYYSLLVLNVTSGRYCQGQEHCCGETDSERFGVSHTVE
jgi:hypothetical protein